MSSAFFDLLQFNVYLLILFVVLSQICKTYQNSCCCSTAFTAILQWAHNTTTFL